MPVEEIKLPISMPGADRATELVGKLIAALDKLEKEAEGAAKGLDKTKSSSDGVANSVNHAGTEFFGAANQAAELAQKVLNAARGLASMADASDRSFEAMRALGPAAARVEAATNGMVTATEAYQFQQRLVRSGLRVSGEELAVLTRAARDHARALGIDTSQALDQLGDALRGGSLEGLHNFGVRLREGTTRGQAMDRTLRELTRQQRGQAPVVRTLTEESTRFTTALGDATGALASFMAQGLGLGNLFSDAANQLQRLSREFADFNNWRQTYERGRNTDNSRIQSLESYQRAVASLRAELNRRGVAMPQFANATQLSQEQRDAASVRIRTLLFNVRARAGQGVDAQALNAQQIQDLVVQGGGIQAETADGASVEQRRRDAAIAAQNRPAARPGRTGPRDSIGVGVQADSASALRQAQLELGLANQNLSLLQVRFGRLGQVISREEELHRLRIAAENTAREGNEKESERLSRVATARTALLQALTEERDRRMQLRDMTQSEAATAAQGALGALGTARSGGPLGGTAQSQLDSFNQIATQLRTTVQLQRNQVGELSRELTAVNVPLSEQIRIRTQLVALQQTLAGNEATLVAMANRDREARQARLELVQSEVAAHGSLYEAARSARESSQSLTQSETQALRNRTGLLSQLTTLERGYRELISQATQEVAAARTEEQRNAALVRRLQLMQQLSGVEGQRRNLEREDARSNVGAQLTQRFNAQIGAQSTAAERFADVASSAYGQFTDAFSSALVAVASGEKTFAEAMSGMLKSVLESIAKMAMVEALKNVALGIGNLAAQNYPGAALNFAAAAAWGVAGAAAGFGAGAIARATTPAATSDKPSTTDRAASAGGPGQGGGGLTINIKVDGALMNEGVEQNVVRAIDRAGIRNWQPRRM